jgi:hypothetical protein
LDLLELTAQQVQQARQALVKLAQQVTLVQQVQLEIPV